MKQLGTTHLPSCLDYNYHAVSQELRQMQPVELHNVLQAFFEQLVTEGKQDPIAVLDRLANMLPPTQLKTDSQDIQEELKKAQHQLVEAESYFRLKAEAVPNIIRREICKNINGLILIIGKFIKLFDISELTDPDVSGTFDGGDPSWMIQSKLMQFTALGSTLTWSLSYAAITPSAPVLGAVFIAMGALGFAWQYIKPVPLSLLQGSVSWTDKIRNGEIFGDGVETTLNRMARILAIPGKHLMLVAPSGTGKTYTAKAFAKALERGDFPDLQGKTVFYVNTATLVGWKSYESNGNTRVLTEIQKKAGRHAKDIILVLDEIHNACVEPSNGPEAKERQGTLSEAMLTFLHDAEFPHVIGITTDKQYNKYVEGSPFGNRFEKMEITNTDKEDTIPILNNYCIQQNCDHIFLNEMTSQIYEESMKVEKAPQPATAIDYLKKCIEKTKNTQESDAQKKINELMKGRKYLHSQSQMGNKADGYQTISTLNDEIAKLEQQRTKEKERIDRLFQARDLIARKKIEHYKSIVKIAKVAHTTIQGSCEQELSRIFLLENFLDAALHKYVDDESKMTNVTTIIDQKVVTTVSAEELKRRKEAKIKAKLLARERAAEQRQAMAHSNPPHRSRQTRVRVPINTTNN